MHWTNFFDGIYVISLDHTKEDNLRMPETKAYLDLYGIPYAVISAMKEIPPAFGIFKTLQRLFRLALGAQKEIILVFEDDVFFDSDPGKTMPAAIQELKRLDWDMLSLGPNTHQPFEKKISQHLLPLYNAYGLHAMAYNKSGMQKVLELKWDGTPIDKMIADQIQPQGFCFCTFPFIATQRNGFSDIEQKQVQNYYIRQRFFTNCEHIW